MLLNFVEWNKFQHITTGKLQSALILCCHMK